MELALRRPVIIASLLLNRLMAEGLLYGATEWKSFRAFVAA